MNQGTNIARISQNPLNPAVFPDDARFMNAPTKPNTFIDKGTVVGFVTSANASAVQRLTPSGVPASGAWSFQVQYPAKIVTSVSIAWNASLATVQAAFDTVFGVGNTVISGSWATYYVITYAGTLANSPQPQVTMLANTLQTSAPAAVTVTPSQTTAGVKNGVLAPYASGNSDGTQVAVGFLADPCYTDREGTVSYGSQEGGMLGLAATTARYAVKGFFRCEELIGLDATAITALGRVVLGSSTLGVFDLQ